MSSDHSTGNVALALEQKVSPNRPAIEVCQLSKRYEIYPAPIDRLKQFLFRGHRQYFREFWALRPLSFCVGHGECVGFVGRNGSGKSTLLQLIAGTLNPTSGSFSVDGRVSALLELGAGFNPEFTGRENVYLNGAIAGLTRAEIDARFGEIERFAEIGDFIDQPVKTYSSGMYVRLAFSVAIHVDPRILLVDEALSVGDAPFQYKCMRKIEQLRANGTSILFVSHDLGAIKRFCSKVGWIHEGRLVAYDDAVRVTDLYEDFSRRQMVGDQPVAAPAPSEPTPTVAPVDLDTNHHAKLVEAELTDSHGVTSKSFITGSPLNLKIRYQVFVSPPDGLVVGAAIYRKDELYVCGLNTYLDKHSIPNSVGQHQVTLSYDKLPLLPGTYYFRLGLFDHRAHVIWDFEFVACEFEVSSPYIGEGAVMIDHKWLNRS